MSTMNLTPEDLEALPVLHRATIPEDYLDAMGHMNVRWYVFLFSEGARELHAAIGMTPEYFDGTNGTFALTQHIRYFAEVHARETVAIRSRFIGRSEKRCHVLHFMVNETTGRIAATMELLFSHANLRTRRTSPFPEEIARRIDERLEEHGRIEWEAPLCGVVRA